MLWWVKLQKEERTQRDTHRGKGHVKTKGEIGAKQLQGKEWHGLLGATTCCEEAKDSSLEPSGGAWPC